MKSKKGSLFLDSSKQDKAYSDVNEEYYRGVRKLHNSVVLRDSRALWFWRFFGIVGFVVFGFMGIYVARNITIPKLVPFVVTVDSTSGSVAFKGVAAGGTDLSDALVRFFLHRFITDLRTIVGDIVVVKNDLASVYLVSSENVQSYISALIRADDPFGLLDRGIRRDVEFRLTEQIAESTWRVEWFELVRENGLVVSRHLVSGVFSFYIKDITSVEEAEFNPVGIIFDDVSISNINDIIGVDEE